MERCPVCGSKRLRANYVDPGFSSAYIEHVLGSVECLDCEDRLTKPRSGIDIPERRP